MCLSKKLFLCLLLILTLCGCARRNPPTSTPTATIPPVVLTQTTAAVAATYDGTPLLWNDIVYDDYGTTQTDATKDVRRMTILRDQQDVDRESEWTGTDYIQQIKNIDFSKDIGLVIHLGLAGENRHTIRVAGIVKKDNLIYVDAFFTSVPPGEVRNPVMTSAYLVITLKKSDIPDQAKFILIFNGEKVDEKTMDVIQ